MQDLLVALLLLSYACLVTINVLWLFIMVTWVGLQCVIVVFPDHTHLLLVKDMFVACTSNTFCSSPASVSLGGMNYCSFLIFINN